MGFLNESTDRQLTEEALLRPNRLLRAIDTCNRVLMQASDEQALLEEELSIYRDRLEELVHDIIRELEPDAAERAIAWRIGDLPAVEGDGAMLRIDLANLIANALKFTRSRQEAQIEIGSLVGTEK